ncbi:hypothetical protein ZWY2020_037500 [Hordeum vulgare]|nr:hypothetical protein ZWY2020_037500 [Hordeum vulgare]
MRLRQRRGPPGATGEASLRRSVKLPCSTELRAAARTLHRSTGSRRQALHCSTAKRTRRRLLALRRRQGCSDEARDERRDASAATEMYINRAGTAPGSPPARAASSPSTRTAEDFRAVASRLPSDRTAAVLPFLYDGFFILVYSPTSLWPPFSSNTPFSSTTGQHYSYVPTFGVRSAPSFGPFGRVSQKGSRVSAYTRTPGDDPERSNYLASISAMPIFKGKSHEELRYEDYKKGDKGDFSLQESRVPWAYHSWQPQPPVNAFINPVKPSSFSYPPEPSSAPVGLQSSAYGTTNPFWLRPPGPQSPLVSYRPEPIDKPSLFSASPFAPSTTCWENVSNNTAAYTAPAYTSSAQGHMFSQNLFPSKSTESGGSLLSSSATHSAPAPSPNGHSTTINIGQAEKTVELVLPIDITTVRIRFSPRNDDTGSHATQVHHNVKASAAPVSFCIYPGENQELTIRSVEQHDKCQTGKPASAAGRYSRNHHSGSAREQKVYINDAVVSRTNPLDPVTTPSSGASVSESVLPRLYKADYYTSPSIAELAARESNEPGCCSHVKDFTVGRHGYGSIKFDGETDVRKLDITSIVEFKYREILVYTDESKRPPVGQELNKPAEITLLNVKCVDKKTGLPLTEGPEVDRYKEILAQWTEKNGAEFLAFDAVKGVWKFRIKHFSASS